MGNSWKIRRIGSKRTIITLILIAIVVLFFVSIPKLAVFLSGISYTTAYQGAKAKYYGAVWNELGFPVTFWRGGYSSPQELSVAPSLYSFDTQMALDVDEPKERRPNVIGEMTAVMIPHVSHTRPDYVLVGWWTDWVNWKEPVDYWEWEIQNDDGTTSFYRMEEWKTKWFISLTAEWDSFGFGASPPYESEKSIKNLQIWFEFDISPSWYFENQTRVYFAIGKIELAQFKNYGLREGGDETSSRQQLSTTPMSPPSILTIYTTPFGAEQSEDTQEFYSFRGQKLNPLFFRDKVYSYITLNDFGCESWWYFIGTAAKGDVVTMGFTVTQFVVGEWVVKDIGDIPDEYGRQGKTQTAGLDIFGGIAEWLSNPFNQLWLLFIIIIIVMIIITVLNPGIWAAMSRRKGK